MKMPPGSFDSFDTTVYSPQFMKKTSKVSSRLAKRQQKKIARQSFLILAVSIVLGLLFLFVVVPWSIRTAGSFLNTGSFIEPEDTVPPHVPTISAPPVATFSGSISVTGFSEANTKVISVVNGSKDSETEANDEGEFEFDIELNNGENTLKFYAVDEAENESGVTKDYLVVYDATDPIIELEYPTDGQEIELSKNQNAEIRGKTEPKARVFLNDRLLFTKSDGSFTGNFLLAEGENVLKFRAVDQAGNESESEITVTFRY